LSEAFDRANLLIMYLLEGMAVANMLNEPRLAVQKMTSWLKRELRRSFQDVLRHEKRS
jgi:predicted nucleotidyltransferase|tara:strand:+ start:2303 stop:2476 length:174 start_codon:yes stop_codon:yes gene_type:complete